MYKYFWGGVWEYLDSKFRKVTGQKLQVNTTFQPTEASKEAIKWWKRDGFFYLVSKIPLNIVLL